MLVACPENTLIDSKVGQISPSPDLSTKAANSILFFLHIFLIQEFLRPIVTPYELELALTSKTWSNNYILDFSTLLTESTFGQDYVDPSLDKNEDKAEDGEEEGPVFSSVTGKYRHPKRFVVGGVTGEFKPSLILG